MARRYGYWMFVCLFVAFLAGQGSAFSSREESPERMAAAGSRSRSGERASNPPMSNPGSSGSTNDGFNSPGREIGDEDAPGGALWGSDEERFQSAGSESQSDPYPSSRSSGSAGSSSSLPSKSSGSSTSSSDIYYASSSLSARFSNVTSSFLSSSPQYAPSPSRSASPLAWSTSQFASPHYSTPSYPYPYATPSSRSRSYYLTPRGYGSGSPSSTGSFAFDGVWDDKTSDTESVKILPGTGDFESMMFLNASGAIRSIFVALGGSRANAGERVDVTLSNQLTGRVEFQTADLEPGVGDGSLVFSFNPDIVRCMNVHSLAIACILQLEFMFPDTSAENTIMRYIREYTVPVLYADITFKPVRPNATEERKGNIRYDTPSGYTCSHRYTQTEATEDEKWYPFQKSEWTVRCETSLPGKLAIFTYKFHAISIMKIKYRNGNVALSNVPGVGIHQEAGEWHMMRIRMDNRGEPFFFSSEYSREDLAVKAAQKPIVLIFDAWPPKMLLRPVFITLFYAGYSVQYGPYMLRISRNVDYKEDMPPENGGRGWERPNFYGASFRPRHETFIRPRTLQPAANASASSAAHALAPPAKRRATETDYEGAYPMSNVSTWQLVAHPPDVTVEQIKKATIRIIVSPRGRLIGVQLKTPDVCIPRTVVQLMAWIRDGDDDDQMIIMMQYVRTIRTWAIWRPVEIVDTHIIGSLQILEFHSGRWLANRFTFESIDPIIDITHNKEPFVLVSPRQKCAMHMLQHKSDPDSHSVSSFYISCVPHDRVQKIVVRHGPYELADEPLLTMTRYKIKGSLPRNAGLFPSWMKCEIYWRQGVPKRSAVLRTDHIPISKPERNATSVEIKIRWEAEDQGRRLRKRHIGRSFAVMLHFLYSDFLITYRLKMMLEHKKGRHRPMQSSPALNGTFS